MNFWAFYGNTIIVFTQNDELDSCACMILVNSNGLWDILIFLC